MTEGVFCLDEAKNTGDASASTRLFNPARSDDPRSTDVIGRELGGEV